MTNKEKIKAEIKRLKIEKRKENLPFHALYYDGYDAACNKIIAYLNSLPAEQQSNSLDNFIQSLLETYPTNKNEVPKEALNDYLQGLICGARKTYNWILESAIKIDAKIVNDETSGCVVDCEQGCLVLEPHRYPIGQKLKILILEDEQCITE